MKLTIFGATGGIGQQTVKLAQAAGHDVKTVDVPQATLPTDLKGELTDNAFITEAIKEADVVIAAIGPSLETSSKLVGKTPVADGIANLMDAMTTLEKTRLIVLGTPSIVAREDNKEAQLSIGANQMAAEYFPNAYVDIKKMDGLLHSSPLEWTVVRYLNPNMEDNGNGVGVTFDLEKAQPDVSRYNIAKFIVDEALKDEYIKKMPFVFNL